LVAVIDKLDKYVRIVLPINAVVSIWEFDKLYTYMLAVVYDVMYNLLLSAAIPLKKIDTLGNKLNV
jgi:hypothetical protein